MLTSKEPPQPHPLRDIITNAYRMDEATSLKALIPLARMSEQSLHIIAKKTKELIENTREYKKKQSKLDSLLHQYSLSTDEGIALMCMAEALLRIPDKSTLDKLISDKISTANWKNHISRDNAFFVNAATWSLLFTGKVYAPTLNYQDDMLSALARASSKLGAAMIRPIIQQMMKTIGKQFIMGETITSALKRAQPLEEMGYTFSYDMLGEAARTEEDAKLYFQSYANSIEALGHHAKSMNPSENPGISIKLSALSPRFEFAQYDRAVAELVPKLLSLAVQAKKYHLCLTVDAEEADRLDITLDIFEKVFTDPALNQWEGLGIAVQAYQKRAPYVIDWLIDLAKRQHKKIMVRLVKGAYWDAEIKVSQVNGFNNYPVYTRKNATDLAFLACANKLLANSDFIYAQFGTHNAYSTAAIMEMAGNTPFEFQCLHGMGRPLYDQIVHAGTHHYPCRIYAPVGTHKELLGYLVRRLLENGANSSFVNKLADEKTPIEEMVIDPVAYMERVNLTPHPRIPLPAAIYQHWLNSEGIDFSNAKVLKHMKNKMDKAATKTYEAASIIQGKLCFDSSKAVPLVSPSSAAEVIGKLSPVTDKQIDHAIEIAHQAVTPWGQKPVEERAMILEHAANLIQANMAEYITLLAREGGRCIQDSVAEVREAIDFCRYYAHRARIDLPRVTLPGPTGEFNQLSMHPRGVIACISPWNFPLAIFTGQIVAALVCGNTVIAKPAEQTPIIAVKTVELLHQAGIPQEALTLILGEGKVGAHIVNHPHIAGVMFTGSTQTAKSIERALCAKPGPMAMLIAETGGQNAMIVDSSALLEQAVYDIAYSAFNSAGQRCSALRVLYVQEEIADSLLSMLKGYMQELQVGDPRLLATDIGPVIDQDALTMLHKHRHKMQTEAKLIAEVALPEQLKGYYFAPCAYELKNLSQLEGEVFGPILHVIRYQSQNLDKVLDDIRQTGYGLTLGIHSRIDATLNYIAERMPVGNIYMNRNMIGAVVGVQPFGGEGLSGTGPKAGGPHYLPRLCLERSISNNTTAVGGNARLISLLEEN